MVQIRLARPWGISTMMDALPVEHVVSVYVKPFGSEVGMSYAEILGD